MSTLQDYTDYQLEESEMILRKRDPPLYNITKDTPWIAQRWLQIQHYLLTGTIYARGKHHGKPHGAEKYDLNLKKNLK